MRHSIAIQYEPVGAVVGAQLIGVAVIGAMMIDAAEVEVTVVDMFNRRSGQCFERH